VSKRKAGRDPVERSLSGIGMRNSCDYCKIKHRAGQYKYSEVEWLNNNQEKTMPNRLDEFQAYRTRMNDRIAEIDLLGIKRFFNLDSMAYKDGALSAKEKELLGLVASMVLRCNDCIDYHILQCVQTGWKDEELYEAFNVALVVGGSILIPHLRHAVESLDLARAEV
jgi:AhpD family alkylhydroperoxidase